MSDVCSSSNSAFSEPDSEPKMSDVFRNIKTEDLRDYTLKMIDALGKDGLPHEVPALFHGTKDTGRIPGVVYDTLIIEHLGNAGQTKGAYLVYLKMISDGVSPTSFTYSVLVRALAADPYFLGLAKKYLLEMVAQGMKPNAATYTAVFEGFAEKAEEGRDFLNQMKGMGFAPEKKAVKEVLKKKNRKLVKFVINILFGSDGDNGRNSKGTRDRYTHPLDSVPVRTLAEEHRDMGPKLEELFGMISLNDVANYAVEMFDVLSLDDLLHPRLQMAQAFQTLVVEKYGSAGRTKEALEMYLLMLDTYVTSPVPFPYATAPSPTPHAYTYAVLIKALAADPNFLGFAKLFLLEMMTKEMTPTAATYTAVIEGFAVAGKVDEGKEFVEELKGKGFVADEEAVREELKSKSGPVVDTVIGILFGS